MSQAEFIRAVLERNFRNIHKAQKLIVSVKGKDLKATKRRKGIGKRTGRLENSVTNLDYAIQGQGSEFTLVLNYPLHMRFLDMRHLGNWKICRYPIWSIINNHTIPELISKYGEAVEDRFGDTLRNDMVSTGKLRNDQIRYVFSLDIKGVDSPLKTITVETQKYTDANTKLISEIKALEQQIYSAQDRLDA